MHDLLFIWGLNPIPEEGLIMDYVFGYVITWISQFFPKEAEDATSAA